MTEEEIIESMRLLRDIANKAGAIELYLKENKLRLEENEDEMAALRKRLSELQAKLDELGA